MFKKLGSTNLLPDWERLKGDIQDEYPNLKIYYIKDKDYLKQFFDPLIKFNIPPYSVHYIEIIGNVEPHIDTHPFTGVVNFVIASADANTIFYEEKDSQSDRKYQNVKSQKSNDVVRRFNSDLIEESYSYTSDNGDFIYLDVSKIHGVKTNSNNIRKLISWRWVHFRYEHLLQHIKVT